jgi:DNA-binding SARP family transcriptional activator
MPAAAAMLRLQLLGERRLSAGACDISAAIRYRKGWALLGYLAVERGRRHPREQIAELLWPSLEPASARTNLRQVLSDLNQVFDRHGGGGLLEATRDGVGLALPAQAVPRSGMAIDLLALEAAEALPLELDEAALVAAEQHVDQLGGEFLPGLALPDCPQFEEWLESTRRRLASVTLETLTRLCRAQQAAGRIPQAIASARRLVALDEWHEGRQRQLMGLLAAAGLHEQALAQYQGLAASLRDELDTVPEARTQALRARIEADQRRAQAAPASGVPAVRALSAQVRRWLGELGGAEQAADTAQPTQRTLPLTGAVPGTAAVRGWLEVERGVEAGRRLVVSPTPVVIGRSRDSDLCLPHDTVSRQHCTVWRDDDGFRIRDLGSTNGTRVNDAVVQEAALSHGDCIVLGGTVLRFSCGGERSPREDTTR